MKALTYLLLLSVVLMACNKHRNDPPNPFNDPANQPPVSNNPQDPLSLQNFAGLHRDVFKPTCSNSGCHDGTFEPDFRTIESSYNTLVHQPIIKNNPAGSFAVRVLPGNALASVLHERLVTDIDGISGIMPLSVDPGSDWPSRKTEYIEAIKAWINNGARDMFGNPPTGSPASPRLQGLRLETGNLLLSFMGDAPEAISLRRRGQSRPISRPVRPLQRPVRHPNLFGDTVLFTHQADLGELAPASYFVWTFNTPEPALAPLHHALTIDIE